MRQSVRDLDVIIEVDESSVIEVGEDKYMDLVFVEPPKIKNKEVEKDKADIRKSLISEI
jgi:hypothetical protein